MLLFGRFLFVFMVALYVVLNVILQGAHIEGTAKKADRKPGLFFSKFLLQMLGVLFARRKIAEGRIRLKHMGRNRGIQYQSVQGNQPGEGHIYLSGSKSS